MSTTKTAPAVETDKLRLAATNLLSLYVYKHGIWYHNVTGPDMEAQQSALTQLKDALASVETEKQ